MITVVRRDGFYDIFKDNRFYRVSKILSGPFKGKWEAKPYYGKEVGWSNMFFVFDTLKEAKERL